MPRPGPTLARLAAAVLLLAVLATAGGCGQFTRPRYETIWQGQPQRGVQAKLGKPHQVRRDAWIYVNRRPFYSAAILFERGQVSGKIWSFEKTIGDAEIRAYRQAYGPGAPKPNRKPKPKSPVKPKPP